MTWLRVLTTSRAKPTSPFKAYQRVVGRGEGGGGKRLQLSLECFLKEKHTPRNHIVSVLYVQL